MTETSSDKQFLSKWAVFSLTISLLPVLGFPDPFLACLAVVGLISGVVALRQIRVRGYRGRALARCGIVVSLGIAITVPIWQARLFSQEAPSSAVRLDFYSLRQSDFEKYEGQEVCLKGYAYPTDQLKGITSFLLLASIDRGARPQVDQFAGVLLHSGTTWSYSGGPLAVTGRLTRNVKHQNGTDPLWILADSSVRPSRTPWQLDLYD